MKKILITFFLVLAIVVACKSVVDAKATVLKINLEAKSNSTVSGIATFSEKNGEVTFQATMTGLTPGVHAIHIHEKSDCSSPDGTSAGGHWNPEFKKHGKWGDAEYHKGDIGNFTADQNGKGTISLKTDEWCIGCDDKTKNILNKSIIVHANPDDFVTQPTGNAGGRVACSGIIR
ncbi:MAG: superoxide dismutase family protein [Flavobacteriia bacterium]|nr:superoxide dismutase family protein [Flavobacteriia bacterium]OIP47173.1 MAG: superoxide dismutase [Flavobacteriaceae bacterium CG2_30_31_66]PIV97674.1 MAG: superoxide dismutase [Flavobacteriaceae bacterium CG17_big_fil_post_rev_8_21_14_2_50_31_13]PIX12255.1 MAG: superoxide dismutase [Flavobacteriaceae bacterium CG_4_8_14_3_um_filter_31_8]PIY13819.1 MAG: superoxide dismutase [Flavobacteriaceae bacterium CG_4_10_14_3_um_filter_31_253]PIZ10705.1 MAG: superoxide dismutase [Flavobacteriaceae ba